MAKPFVSIIIPAYNEAERLPMTLVDVDKHLTQQEYSYEIIVVNDGSTDKTAEIVKRFMPLVKNLKLADQGENKGKGAAVRLGMLTARGNWRVFMDADNSTSVIEFNKMLPYFKEGYEIVICSRSAKGSVLKPAQPIHKQALGKLGNLFVQLMLLKGLKDTQCGFKGFSEEVAHKIFMTTKIDNWAFDIEALALARIMGYKIKEIPVVWTNHPYSHVKLGDYVRLLWDMIRIKWWLWRKKYNLV